MIKIRRSKTLKNILNIWPGKQYFGLYRFLPLFFVLGAALEYSMINWRVGEVNFCRCLIFLLKKLSSVVN
ncbi:UNVERIFIED_CONTAM: hypothetical protein GTU68_026590 [Idotea baltica]|nr:hypothetical protein [Idotea baltica]